MRLYNAAKAAHDIWAHWMNYFFTQCVEQPDGSLVVPADKVKRWKRLANTSFMALTEEEAKSDYEIAEQYLSGKE